MATPIQYKKAIFTNWATKLIETKGNASAIKAEKAAVLDVGKVDKKACLDKCVAMREIIASCSNLDITPGHTIDLRDRTRVKNILLKHDAGTAQWAEDVLKNGAQHLGVDVTPDELLDKLIVKMLDLVGNGFYKKDLGFNSDVDAVVEIFKFYKDLCFIQGSTPESEECRNRLVAFLFHGNGGLQGYENMTSVDQMQTFFKTDGERSSSSPFCSESLVKLFTMSAVHRHSGTDGVASFFGNWRGMVTRTACKALKEFVFTNEQGFQNALKSVMVAKLDSHISEEEVITQQNNCNSILERVNIGTIGDEAKFHDYQSATYRGTMAEIKNYFFSAYKTINNSVVDKCIENLVKKAQSFFGSYESIQINDSEIGLDKLYNSLAGVETYIQDIGIKNDRLEESADKAQSADESRELAMKSDSPAVKEATKRGYIEFEANGKGESNSQLQVVYEKTLQYLESTFKKASQNALMNKMELCYVRASQIASVDGGMSPLQHRVPLLTDLVDKNMFSMGELKSLDVVFRDGSIDQLTVFNEGKVKFEDLLNCVDWDKFTIKFAEKDNLLDEINKVKRGVNKLQDSAKLAGEIQKNSKIPGAKTLESYLDVIRELNENVNQGLKNIQLKLDAVKIKLETGALLDQAKSDQLIRSKEFVDPNELARQTKESLDKKIEVLNDALGVLIEIRQQDASQRQRTLHSISGTNIDQPQVLNVDQALARIEEMKQMFFKDLQSGVGSDEVREAIEGVFTCINIYLSQYDLIRSCTDVLNNHVEQNKAVMGLIATESILNKSNILILTSNKEVTDNNKLFNKYLYYPSFYRKSTLAAYQDNFNCLVEFLYNNTLLDRSMEDNEQGKESFQVKLKSILADNLSAKSKGRLQQIGDVSKERDDIIEELWTFRNSVMPFIIDNDEIEKLQQYYISGEGDGQSLAPIANKIVAATKNEKIIDIAKIESQLVDISKKYGTIEAFGTSLVKIAAQYKDHFQEIEQSFPSIQSEYEQKIKLYSSESLSYEKFAQSYVDLEKAVRKVRKDSASILPAEGNKNASGNLREMQIMSPNSPSNSNNVSAFEHGLYMLSHPNETVLKIDPVKVKKHIDDATSALEVYEQQKKELQNSYEKKMLERKKDDLDLAVKDLQNKNTILNNEFNAKLKEYRDACGANFDEKIISDVLSGVGTGNNSVGSSPMGSVSTSEAGTPNIGSPVVNRSTDTSPSLNSRLSHLKAGGSEGSSPTESSSNSEAGTPNVGTPAVNNVKKRFAIRHSAEQIGSAIDKLEKIKLANEPNKVVKDSANHEPVAPSEHSATPYDTVIQALKALTEVQTDENILSEDDDLDAERKKLSDEITALEQNKVDLGVETQRLKEAVSKMEKLLTAKKEEVNKAFEAATQQIPQQSGLAADVKYDEYLKLLAGVLGLNAEQSEQKLRGDIEAKLENISKAFAEVDKIIAKVVASSKYSYKDIDKFLGNNREAVNAVFAKAHLLTAFRQMVEKQRAISPISVDFNSSVATSGENDSSQELMTALKQEIKDAFRDSMEGFNQFMEDISLYQQNEAQIKKLIAEVDKVASEAKKEQLKSMGDATWIKNSMIENNISSAIDKSSEVVFSLTQRLFNPVWVYKNRQQLWSENGFISEQQPPVNSRRHERAQTNLGATATSKSTSALPRFDPQEAQVDFVNSLPKNVLISSQKIGRKNKAGITISESAFKNELKTEKVVSNLNVLRKNTQLQQLVLKFRETRLACELKYKKDIEECSKKLHSRNLTDEIRMQNLQEFKDTLLKIHWNEFSAACTTILASPEFDNAPGYTPGYTDVLSQVTSFIENTKEQAKLAHKLLVILEADKGLVDSLSSQVASFSKADIEEKRQINEQCKVILKELGINNGNVERAQVYCEEVANVLNMIRIISSNMRYVNLYMARDKANFDVIDKEKTGRDSSLSRLRQIFNARVSEAQKNCVGISYDLTSIGNEGFHNYAADALIMLFSNQKIEEYRNSDLTKLKADAIALDGQDVKIKENNAKENGFVKKMKDARDKVVDNIKKATGATGKNWYEYHIAKGIQSADNLLRLRLEERLRLSKMSIDDKFNKFKLILAANTIREVIDNSLINVCIGPDVTLMNGQELAANIENMHKLNKYIKDELKKSDIIYNIAYAIPKEDDVNFIDLFSKLEFIVQKYEGYQIDQKVLLNSLNNIRNSVMNGYDYKPPKQEGQPEKPVIRKPGIRQLLADRYNPTDKSAVNMNIDNVSIMKYIDTVTQRLNAEVAHLFVVSPADLNQDSRIENLHFLLETSKVPPRLVFTDREVDQKEKSKVMDMLVPVSGVSELLKDYHDNVLPVLIKHKPIMICKGDIVPEQIEEVMVEEVEKRIVEFLKKYPHLISKDRLSELFEELRIDLGGEFRIIKGVVEAKCDIRIDGYSTQASAENPDEIVINVELEGGAKFALEINREIFTKFVDNSKVRDIIRNKLLALYKIPSEYRPDANATSSEIIAVIENIPAKKVIPELNLNLSDMLKKHQVPPHILEFLPVSCLNRSKEAIAEVGQVKQIILNVVKDNINLVDSEDIMKVWENLRAHEDIKNNYSIEITDKIIQLTRITEPTKDLRLEISVASFNSFAKEVVDQIKWDLLDQLSESYEIVGKKLPSKRNRISDILKDVDVFADELTKLTLKDIPNYKDNLKKILSECNELPRNPYFSHGNDTIDDIVVKITIDYLRNGGDKSHLVDALVKELNVRQYNVTFSKDAAEIVISSQKGKLSPVKISVALLHQFVEDSVIRYNQELYPVLTALGIRDDQLSTNKDVSIPLASERAIDFLRPRQTFLDLFAEKIHDYSEMNVETVNRLMREFFLDKGDSISIETVISLAPPPLEDGVEPEIREYIIKYMLNIMVYFMVEYKLTPKIMQARLKDFGQQISRIFTNRLTQDYKKDEVNGADNFAFDLVSLFFLPLSKLIGELSDQYIPSGASDKDKVKQYKTLLFRNGGGMHPRHMISKFMESKEVKRISAAINDYSTEAILRPDFAVGKSVQDISLQREATLRNEVWATGHKPTATANAAKIEDEKVTYPWTTGKPTRKKDVETEHRHNQGMATVAQQPRNPENVSRYMKRV